jgi:hypothetical protein
MRTVSTVSVGPEAGGRTFDMAMTWKAMRNALDADDLLERVGLERRTPAGDIMTGLGLFAVGVLVGAGLGLMFAPKRGDEIRSALNDAWRHRGRRAQDFGRDLGVEGGVPPGTSTTSGH